LWGIIPSAIIASIFLFFLVSQGSSRNTVST
jgi:hypothetical protein